MHRYRPPPDETDPAFDPGGSKNPRPAADPDAAAVVDRRSDSYGNSLEATEGPVVDAGAGPAQHAEAIVASANKTKRRPRSADGGGSATSMTAAAGTVEATLKLLAAQQTAMQVEIAGLKAAANTNAPAAGGRGKRKRLSASGRLQSVVLAYAFNLNPIASKLVTAVDTLQPPRAEGAKRIADSGTSASTSCWTLSRAFTSRVPPLAGCRVRGALLGAHAFGVLIQC